MESHIGTITNVLTLTNKLYEALHSILSLGDSMKHEGTHKTMLPKRVRLIPMTDLMKRKAHVSKLSRFMLAAS